MAERRKNRKRKDDPQASSEKSGVGTDKPTKDEYAVAKWIRANVPSKKTKFHSHNVEYFTGSRAVGALLDNSPWSKTLFETREHVTEFLDTMLRHKFFHRAKKIVVTEEELNKIRNAKKKNGGKEMTKEEKKLLEKEGSKDELKDAEVKESKEGKEKKEEEERKETKKKPKVRLEMHIDQYFMDCNDAYVWIYEPIPVYYWFFGTLVVLGAIGLCLFPLWPLTIRHGVYYLSVAGAGFFVFILILAVVRVIVFSLLWLLTLGRHHFWLLPNLAEDVGFFSSFWPLYQYEYCSPCNDGDKKSSKKKRHRKDKDSDGEDDGTVRQSNVGNEEKECFKTDESSTVENKAARPEERRKETTAESNCEEGSEEGSESEKSNTGRDFEMVQHNELDDK